MKKRVIAVLDIECECDRPGWIDCMVTMDGKIFSIIKGEPAFVRETIRESKRAWAAIL